MLSLTACFAANTQPANTAAQILEITGARAALREEFTASVDAISGKLTTTGFPPEGIKEIRVAMIEWFEQEIKWEYIQPKLVAAYERNFTPEELTELLSFYQTPLGRKAATKLPSLLLEVTSIRQEYAAQKQDSLNQRIQSLVAKYNSPR